MKNKQLLIKVETELYNAYKELCKTKGFNMSQRIRNFIEIEIKNESK